MKAKCSAIPPVSPSKIIGLVETSNISSTVCIRDVILTTSISGLPLLVESVNELSQIASHNFKQLNASNITTLCNDGVQYLNHSKDPFDGIYIDPSRRQEHKGRVFLLEDCQPNVPSILEILFSRSKTILIKTSPMRDISSAVRALHSVKEIHVIAVMGEVKELLFLLKKYHLRPILIHTVNILKNTSQYFSFRDNEQADSQYDTPKKYLYEPNVAILKAGGFHHISKQLRVCKLHPQSHLYTSNQLLDFPGRSFQITPLLNYDKKKLKMMTTHETPSEIQRRANNCEKTA